MFTREVVVWSMLATLSLGYWSVIALAPEWLDDLTPVRIAASGTALPSLSERAVARLAADVSSVRDSVARIQLDVAKLRTDVDAQEEIDKSFSAELASVATRVGASGGGQQANAQGNAPAPPPPQRPASTAPKSSSTPPTAPTVINAGTGLAAALETGSVTPPVSAIVAPGAAAALKAAKAAPADIDFGPAVVKPVQKPLGVQLSTGASVDSLRLSWSLLAERHGDVLANMEPRARTGINGGEPAYDLVVGPIKSKAEAAKVCKALEAKGVPCKVGDFAGDAL